MRAQRTDVIVVGAGPCGVLAAEQLRTFGLRVLLLEAGGRDRRREEPTSEDDPRWRYRSLGIGGRLVRGRFLRAHGVGGNTLLWGGWANRFPDDVLRAGGFPYGARTLADDYRRVERWLRVEEEELAPRYRCAGRALGVRFLPRRTARLGRRTWTARHPQAARSARTQTTALRLVRAPGSSEVVAIEVQGPQGCERLAARAFVLAASPLETFRILAASQVEHPALGRGLRDHVVVHALLLEPPSDSVPGSAFVPVDGRFSIEVVGPWRMSARDRARLRAAGIDPPRGTRLTRLHAMGALEPNSSRFLDLAPRATDALGRRLVQVRYAWSAFDRLLVDEMKASVAAVAEAVVDAGSGAQLVELPGPFADPLLFHPSGTCVLGSNDDAPCDAHGRLRPAPNVWIADASVLPTPGDRHPTLTLLAHTLRMTRSLLQQLSRGTNR